jgi:alanyl-tRNA synthetase
MKNLSTNQIRSLFLEYFEKQGHKILPSSPVVPHNDNTLLFTNSGMVQFKEIFTGLQKSDFKTVSTSQKCIRAGGKHNDLENVGYTARHHTFFEMLGNFSFGDYFKEKAIFYAWDFLTNYLELPKDKLYVTIYYNDDEAFELWKKIANLDDSKIIRIETKDNFWEMGDTGPCGPCSEIFYDYGDQYEGGLPGSPEQDDGERYIEIWNLVFMQFEKVNGELIPLPKKSVDTGMGLERIAAVCQKVHDNYQIDLFQKIIDKISELTQIKFTNDLHDLNYICARVIADHLRSASFLIADGVLPGNTGRNYVLKRIIRRATIYLYKMGYREGLIYKLVDTLVGLMSSTYKELLQNQNLITQSIKEEEESFFLTLERGFKQFNTILENLGEGKIISGKDAFKLYDTFGLPIDITSDIAKSHNLEVDLNGFDIEMNAQKEVAKASWKNNTKYNNQNNEILSEILEKCGETKFTGYENCSEKDCSLLKIFEQNGKTIAIFDKTPCYAESGGQIGDSGIILNSDNAIVGEILDAQKISGLFLHEVKIKSELKEGEKYHILINKEKRNLIKSNHTATHLLHKALKMVLGENVNQKGSLVNDEKLRFDFNYNKSISNSDLQKIESIVNREISQGSKVDINITDRESAIKTGAMALFDEKYGNNVRVVSIGENEKFSIELCGGTHASNTNEILVFKIISDELIASGIRRIEALTNIRAIEYLNNQSYIIKNLEQTLKCKESDIANNVNTLKTQNFELNKELNLLKKEFIKKNIQNLANNDEIVYYCCRNQDVKILREIAMDLSQSDNSIYLIINSNSDNNINSIFLSISKNIASEKPANKILEKIAKEMNFKPGGGNQNMASTNAENINLDKLKNYLINEVKNA